MEWFKHLSFFSLFFTENKMEKEVMDHGQSEVPTVFTFEKILLLLLLFTSYRSAIWEVSLLTAVT